MKYVLWAVQIAAALAFLGAGVSKLITPADELVQTMPWVTAMPGWLIVFISVAEIAGALGLILPALTRIQPQLTPLAGAGLALVMLFAMIFHITRSEFSDLVPNLVLLLLAAFAAYGRWKLLPIAPKNT